MDEETLQQVPVNVFYFFLSGIRYLGTTEIDSFVICMWLYLYWEILLSLWYPVGQWAIAQLMLPPPIIMGWRARSWVQAYCVHNLSIKKTIPIWCVPVLSNRQTKGQEEKGFPEGRCKGISNPTSSLVSSMPNMSCWRAHNGNSAWF